MKKLIKFSAIVLLGMTCAALPAMAHENDEQDQQNDERVYTPNAQFQRYDGNREGYDGRPRRRGDGLGQLQREVDHLNGMVAHVRNSMRRYGADRHMWQEYGHLQAEVRQLNSQFQRGEQYYNRSRLRAQIAHMHDELHHLEEELHMPSTNYFQWGG